MAYRCADRNDAGARPRQAEQRCGPGGDAVDGLRRARRVVPQRRRLGRAVVVCGVARRGARRPLVLREAQQLVGVRAVDDARSRVDGEVVEGAEPLRGRVRVEGAQARLGHVGGRRAAERRRVVRAGADLARGGEGPRDHGEVARVHLCVIDRVGPHAIGATLISTPLVYREPLTATRLLERREEPLERVRRVGPGRLDGEGARRVREHLGAARRVDGFA